MPTAPVYADLHAHTTASDGTETPTELVTLARAAGLTYLAVTDHDTTAALAEAERAAREVGIRLLPGVELSAEGKPGKCHLLGLGIDPSHAPLTLDEITALAPPGANIGRPHFAHALIVRGYVRDNAEAFAKYLADDAAAYVTKKTLTPAAAIDLVHAAGGLCFIAHPGLLRLAEHETYETRLRALQAVGLDGLEAYYSAYTPALTDQLVRLAAKLDLLVTGGSDFHGANKAHVTLGAVLDGGPLPASLLPHTLLDRALPA
jgi:predicted metal-dependent phosphoesterase TrpH